jgi:hypothetical protein
MNSILSNKSYAEDLGKFSTQIFEKFLHRISKEYTKCLSIGQQTNIYITKSFHCIQSFISADPEFNVENNFKLHRDYGFGQEARFEPGIITNNDIAGHPLDKLMGFFGILKDIDFDDELIELFMTIAKRGKMY